MCVKKANKFKGITQIKIQLTSKVIFFPFQIPVYVLIFPNCRIENRLIKYASLNLLMLKEIYQKF